MIAVNVWPFPGQLVGVLLSKAEPQIEGVHYFPLRVGPDSKPITPEQIHMFMDARIRRIAMCLEQAVGQRVVLTAKKYQESGSRWTEAAKVSCVEPIKNAVTLLMDDPTSAASKGGPIPLSLPLDVVETACLSDGVWQLYSAGTIERIEWHAEVDPALAGIKLRFNPLG